MSATVLCPTVRTVIRIRIIGLVCPIDVKSNLAAAAGVFASTHNNKFNKIVEVNVTDLQQYCSNNISRNTTGIA